MVFVAEFALEHDELAMGPTSTENPSARIRLLDTPVQDSAGEAVSFVEVGAELVWSEFESQLDSDSTVHSWRNLLKGNAPRLYCVEHVEYITDVFRVAAEQGAYLEAAWLEDGAWFTRFVVPNHSVLSSLVSLFDANGIAYVLESVQQDPAQTRRGGASTEMTEAQYDVLAYAFEHGYFEVPREVTQDEIADHFGISESAVSQQIRHGVNRFLQSHFPVDEGETPEVRE